MANVPNVPGVPPLATGFAAASSIVLLTQDVISFFAGSGLIPQWGIFQNGIPVVAADSVASVGYKQEWTISNYPVEQGAFETYDKVSTPFDARVRYAAGGSEANRQALLDSIAAIAGDLNFYDVVTPEAVYTSVNVQRYDYQRTARDGVGLLQVDVWLTEIRVTTTSAFSNTKTPSGANPVSGGNVLPSTPTSAQIKEIPDVQ